MSLVPWVAVEGSMPAPAQGQGTATLPPVVHPLSATELAILRALASAGDPPTQQVIQRELATQAKKTSK